MKGLGGGVGYRCGGQLEGLVVDWVRDDGGTEAVQGDGEPGEISNIHRDSELRK